MGSSGKILERCIPTSDIIVNKTKNDSLIDYMHVQLLRVKNSRSDCTTLFNESTKSNERVPLPESISLDNIQVDHSRVSKNWNASRRKITSKVSNFLSSLKRVNAQVFKDSECCIILLCSRNLS